MDVLHEMYELAEASIHRTTSQYCEDRWLRITTVSQVDLSESSVMVMDVHWTHGIYGTDEHELYALIFDAYCNDNVLTLRDGTIEQWTDANPLHVALGAHAAETA